MQKYVDEVRRFFELCNQNGAATSAASGVFGEIEKQAALFKHLLAPKLVPGKELIRLGAANDGGYLMYDPGRDGVAYSLGIGAEVSWDLAMAGRGFQVFQYDGSVDGPPQAHNNFHFRKMFIDGHPGPNRQSLERLLEENAHTQRHDLILQMDIEGAEWAVLESAAPAPLNAFAQIIIEFHLPAQQLMYLPMCNHMLKKLNLSHQVIHTHINNNGVVLNFGQEQLWTVVEVTYLRRDQYKFVKSAARYPLPLDAPCDPAFEDATAGFLGLA